VCRVVSKQSFQSTHTHTEARYSARNTW